MFEKRHRITLLFNANKAYDRQVVEGVGEYLQASQLEWDIFIEDFRARIENIKEWLGDGVIADYDDPEIESYWPMSTSPSSASAALIISQSSTRRSTISPRTTPRWWKAPFFI
jgi:hypothetical protein